MEAIEVLKKILRDAELLIPDDTRREREIFSNELKKVITVIENYDRRVK